MELGKKSKERLETCDERLVKVFTEVSNLVDITILCGHRTKEDQDNAVKNGTSKLTYPNSKHNSFPSKAVDVALYPVDWSNKEGFIGLARLVLDVAKRNNVKLKWGGDWNMNGSSSDERFIDMPHFEIVD